MKLKSKLLASIIALALLCTGTYTGASAENDAAVSDSIEVSEENQEKQVQKVPENISTILQNLGLMDESEMKIEGYVSRGFAAEVLFRFNNIYDSGTATGEMYIDVPAENPYAYAIETSSMCGYFFGTGDGKFSPDANILPTQMATVLLRLAGYPNNSIMASSEFGKLLKNVGSYEYLTYYGLAKMLYNFLDVNIIELSGFSKSNPKYTKSDTKTILDSYFDVKRYEGIITENSITGLWSGSDLEKNRVLISDNGKKVVIDAGDTDVNLMIGRYIAVYCKYDEKRNLSVCLYYDVLDGRNTITEIDLFDIDYARSTDSQIVYYPFENQKDQAKYSNKTAVIYNGTYYSDTVAILSKVNGKNGKITVIDNDSDGIADVFNVEAYDTYIVSSVILSNSTVCLKNTNQSLSLKESDYDQFSVADESGNKVFIEDFVDGMVLSVATNSSGADKNVIKAFVTEQRINGTVTDVYKNELDKDVIRLDGINDYVLLNGVGAPRSGQSVILMLDAFGKVAWIDYSNAGEFLYGVITKVKYRRKTDSVIIKMITSKNTIEEFEVQNKLTVDKNTYKDMNNLYKKLYNEDNITVGSCKFPAGVYPVRYRFRTDGTLAEIDTSNVDTAAGESANTFKLMASGEHYLQNQLIMGGTFALRESTPVFRIRGEKDSSGIVDIQYFEDTKYTSMGNVQSLMSTGRYNYAAYKVDDDSLFADFLVVYSGWGLDYTDTLFVIEKIREVYDESTDRVLISVHGVENGVEKDLIVSELYQETFKGLGLVCGDVIRYQVDGYNHLIKVEDDDSVIKHKSDGIQLGNIGNGREKIEDFKTSDYSTQMIYGYVLERRDNYILLSTIKPGVKVDGKRAKADMEKETVLVKIPSTVPIALYNPSEEEKVSAVTYDEILDYKHSGKNCSLMALHYRSVRLLEVVVLNDYDLYK